MRAVENISQELFDKIRSRVSSIRLGDETGAVTTDPQQARFFEFNFKHRNLPVGAVTISLNEEGILQVYFPNSMVEDVDTSTADAWYGFLKELSRFSARNMLNYETHNVTKERLDKKDYQFLTQRSQDEVMENRMYGTSQKSFLEQGTAKLIIQHDKTVDETKMGARSRNIKAIYIENADGERFKFANNYLPGARAMARHISNEGHTRDDRGQHIVGIMHEMNDLKTFVRAIKREDYVTDEQNEIIEAATDRYYGLKDTLKSLASANGYQSYFENWVPEAVEDEGDLDDLKEKLTRSVYDDRLTSALPAVRRAMQERTRVREANDDEALKIAMGDEPIEIYDNEADMAEIKNYMQYIKNSDMEAQRKNMALVVAIVKFLVKNATDDNLANAMSEFDVENKKHMAAGYALAKKFIQGKYEVKKKAAKKDLYGKDKNESVTFESFEQSMEMISEGTWHLFRSDEDIKDFIDLLKNPIKAGEEGEDAANAVMKFVGDDDMLDDLAEFAEKNGANRDARPAIIKWLKKNQYGGRYGYTKQYTDAMKAVLAGLKGKAESVEESELREGQVLFRVQDQNGEVYEIEKDIHGELVAFDANPEQEAGGGMGPYDYYQDTGIIDHPIAGKLKTMKVESVQEGVAEADEAVKAWAEKYNKHMGTNQDPLAHGWLQANLNTGIESDGYNDDEYYAYNKKYKHESDLDWEDEDQERFFKESPITSAMHDEIDAIMQKYGIDEEDVNRIVGYFDMKEEQVKEGHKDHDDAQKILDKDGVEIFAFDHDGDGSAIEVYVNGKEVASGYYDSLAGDMVIDGSSFVDKESVASYYKPKVKEDITEMMTLKCKDCGDMLGEPTTDCPHDSQDPKGDNWIMVDVDNDGDMDLAVANEGADPEIVAKFARIPDSQRSYYVMQWAKENGIDTDEAMEMAGYEKGSYMGAGAYNWHYVGEEIEETFEETQEVDEAAESIAKLKAMAGVGSKFRSNHGIHEGEEGYQITPRSIVARELRKLQEIEKGS